MANRDFNWSILDRRGLTALLWSVYPEIVDQPITATKAHSILSKHIKRYLPVRINKKLDAEVEKDWIYVGGCYYSDYDQDYIKCIEVNFHYPLFYKKIIISKTRFKRICKSFADVILHEIIHMRQYRRREFKIIPDYESNAERHEQRVEQSYLGCPDEIDAYGFNMACELLDKFNGNTRKVYEYIGKKHRRGQLKSTTLRMYLKAFDYNQNHKIVKKVKAKAIRYIPNAEIGRPYRTADWIKW